MKTINIKRAKVSIQDLQGFMTIKTTTITGFEANVLLFALDQYLRVDKNGRVRHRIKGYTSVELQSLRDRLMAIHEHPDDDMVDITAALSDEVAELSAAFKAIDKEGGK